MKKEIKKIIKKNTKKIIKKENIKEEDFIPQLQNIILQYRTTVIASLILNIALLYWVIYLNY